jgi:DNA-binding CsgD family transcriptional regulator
VSDPATVAPPGSRLTPSEEAALRAMWDHGTIERAARALGRSPHTVRGHLANARSRLGVSTTIEAIREAGI